MLFDTVLRRLSSRDRRQAFGDIVCSAVLVVAVLGAMAYLAPLLLAAASGR